jgi:ATP-dependent Lon protease
MKNNGVKDEELWSPRNRRARHRPLLHAGSRRAFARTRAVQDLPQGGQGPAAEEDDAAGEGQCDNLNDFLGVRKFTYGRAEKQNQVGQVVGLAWTEVGGDLLTIEAALMPGKGVIQRTGRSAT